MARAMRWLFAVPVLCAACFSKPGYTGDTGGGDGGPGDAGITANRMFVSSTEVVAVSLTGSAPGTMCADWTSAAMADGFEVGWAPGPAINPPSIRTPTSACSACRSDVAAGGLRNLRPAGAEGTGSVMCAMSYARGISHLALARGLLSLGP